MTCAPQKKENTSLTHQTVSTDSCLIVTVTVLFFFFLAVMNRMNGMKSCVAVSLGSFFFKHLSSYLLRHAVLTSTFDIIWFHLRSINPSDPLHKAWGRAHMPTEMLIMKISFILFLCVSLSRAPCLRRWTAQTV